MLLGLHRPVGRSHRQGRRPCLTIHRRHRQLAPIYLLHDFVVYRLSGFVSEHIVELGRLEVALLVAPSCSLVMIPIGHLGDRFVESPLLRFRRPYLRPAPGAFKTPTGP